MFGQSGGFGHSPGNVLRDLEHAYMKDNEMPPVSPHSKPCIDKRGDLETVVYEDAGIIYPHDWIHHLSRHDSDDFERLFAPSQIEWFWQNVPRADPKLLDHPLFDVVLLLLLLLLLCCSSCCCYCCRFLLLF